MAKHPEAGNEPADRPDFGPSGYLPDRAAKRARKIVLRAPLGAQWIVGAILAGILVVIAGVLYLQGRDAPPPAPWVAVGVVTDLEVSEFDADLDALIVTAGGRARAFSAAGHVSYCTDSNRLEAADGGVWSLTGRGLDGTPSLEEHPTLLSADRLYVDPSRTVPAPPATDEPVTRGCT